MMTKFALLRRCPIAAMALLSLPFAAHADVASKVDVSLTNLQYRLVDLTPDDGQAPGLTVYDETVSLGAGISGGPREGSHVAINPLPSAPFKADAGGGNFAEVGPHTLGTHA